MKNIAIKILLAVVSVLLAALVCVDVWILSRATNGFETSLFVKEAVEEEEEKEVVDFEITRDAVLRDTFRDDDGYIEDVFYYDNFCLYCEGVCEGHTRYTTESGLQYNFRPEYVEIDLGQGDAFEAFLVFKDRPAKDDLYFNAYPRCIEVRGDDIDFSDVHINQSLRYYLTEDPGKEIGVNNTDEWKYKVGDDFVNEEATSVNYYYVLVHYRAWTGEYETDIDYDTTCVKCDAAASYEIDFSDDSFHDGFYTLYMTGDESYSYDFYLDTDEEYPELEYEKATVGNERIENSNRYYVWHSGQGTSTMDLPKNLPTLQCRAATDTYFCLYDAMYDYGTGFESYKVYNNIRAGGSGGLIFQSSEDYTFDEYTGWAEDIEWGGYDRKSKEDIGTHKGAFLEDTYEIRDGAFVYWFHNVSRPSDTLYYDWITYQPNLLGGMWSNGSYIYPENYIITYDMAGNEKIYLLRLYGY